MEGFVVSHASVVVVLPTLGNRPELFRRALESCVSLQELVPTTIVVIAPRVATDVRRLARDRGALVLDDPGKGMSTAVNMAIEARSKDDYYVWLGDDDELVGPGVVTLVETLEHFPEAVMAYGYCEYVDEKGSLIGANKAGVWARFLLAWGPNLIPHPGTVIRLGALQSIGGFDSALHYALDLDVFLRLRSVGRAVSRPVVSARFRWHAESATVANRASSSREAIAVKTRNLPRWMRSISPLWNYPVAWSSLAAAWLVTFRARRLVP